MDVIVGFFVFIIMVLFGVIFVFWYFFGMNLFFDVLLNDVVGLDGDILFLSFKFVIDVFVVVCFCVFGLVMFIVVFVGIFLGVK